MENKRIGLLGGTSLVGNCLLSYLTDDKWQVTVLSRKPNLSNIKAVRWCQVSSLSALLSDTLEQIPYWICVAPVWVLPDYFALLKACGARRVVALSSTSRFTKTDSSDASEQALALKLVAGEDKLRVWAENNGIEWVVLRPTLIYGRGQDKNLCEIAHFIRRFGFFPLLGDAMGLRQPVHVQDVASACMAALLSPVAASHAYNISGGEMLPYREMVMRIFTALNRNPRLLTIPLGVFRLAISCLSILPRYRHWSPAMAERMNRDMVFDHAEAVTDLHFAPRPFLVLPDDLPL